MARFSGGHIRTQNFDSSTLSSDLDFLAGVMQDVQGDVNDLQDDVRSASSTMLTGDATSDLDLSDPAGPWISTDVRITKFGDELENIMQNLDVATVQETLSYLNS